MNKLFKDLLISTVGKSYLVFDEPMSKHTTFKIGGFADAFLEPCDYSIIASVISLCKEYNIPYTIIGKGSNLLVGDKGIRGVVICIYGVMDKLEFDEYNDICKVTAQTGIMLSKMSKQVADKGYEGFEFAAGIPGTLGGAVTMNAGAYGGEIKDCIKSAKVMDNDGNISILDKEQLDLGYRHSIIQDKNLIVIEAEFEFKKGDISQIYDRMNDYNGRRREKQPLEYPSAGSTFKRPEGYFAGKLIMDSGLKGYRVGDACVSEKHCGFVINMGNATAQDTLTLIKNVDNVVFDKYGVHLEPEVRIIGEF